MVNGMACSREGHMFVHIELYSCFVREQSKEFPHKKPTTMMQILLIMVWISLSLSLSLVKTHNYINKCVRKTLLTMGVTMKYGRALTTLHGSETC